MELTLTRLYSAMPASRKAISKAASLSFSLPTPFTRKISLGIILSFLPPVKGVRSHATRKGFSLGDKPHFDKIFVLSGRASGAFVSDESDFCTGLRWMDSFKALRGYFRHKYFWHGYRNEPEP